VEHSLVGAIVVDDADTLAVVLSVVNLLSLGVAAESLRIEQLWNYRFLAGAVNVDDRQRPFGVTRLLIIFCEENLLDVRVDTEASLKRGR